MPRLTKGDIELALVTGTPVAWREANGKPASIHLDSAKQRRLFAFLLKSKVRDVKGLPAEFVDGLAAAFVAPGDPADGATAAGVAAVSGGPWKIHAIKVEGFGGVNAWNGNPFTLELDGESLLIEGPNGSGKSSLIAALVWGLTDVRPRDQDDTPSNEAKPVFGSDEKQAGAWPPVATYPTELVHLKQAPAVSVEITFASPTGKFAAAKRTFDGKKTAFAIDQSLHIPSILLEAGLLMPSRLPQLRLDQGGGRLTDAVQTLTGLDDLIELGTFVQALCHHGREYLTYKSGELADAKAAFEKQIEKTRAALAPVKVTIPSFKPGDTESADGDMAKLGKTLNERASELTKVIADDLANGLDLTDPQVQKQIGVALLGAEEDVKAGLEGLPTWKVLQSLHDALTGPIPAALRATVTQARGSLGDALAFRAKQQADNKYRLKAAAARWHAEHGGIGDITDCPLCTHTLKDNPTLQKELNALRFAGEAAARTLIDNVNTISATLEKAVPQPLKRYLSDALPKVPRASLLAEVRAKFVTSSRYTKYLAKCGALVAASCNKTPGDEFKASPEVEQSVAETAALIQTFSQIEAMCTLTEWFVAQRGSWEKWWGDLATCEPPADGTPKKDPEPLTVHLRRLSESLGEAEPYRVAAEAMRTAWKEGKAAAKIEKEQARRSEIAEALEPLKQLRNLAEAQARAAIDDLSDRIAAIHGATYITDALRFEKTALEKKAGLLVRGKLSEQIRIDATLVANTSWLRGVLWAFIFALREEAVEQLGADPFPVLLMDDPQQTFDSQHRHRWAEQVAKLQKGAPGVQVILTTHEELFLSFLGMDGVTGRHALICSAGPELGRIGLFEGEALDRAWIALLKDKTPAAARKYMASVREFVEGMLKLMLRGEDVSISTSVIGDCREKLSGLNKAGLEPWSKSAFATLAALLGKGVPEIKFIEAAHHSTGAHLGMGEATDVEAYWRKKLRPALERAFRIAREHRALHGGLTALHAMPPTVTLPEGHKPIVSGLKFPLIGTAAALTDGRVADGCVDLTLIAATKDIIELKDHLIFQITAATLEPVARPGDLLLVAEHTPPTPKSLVVAMNEDRLLARRLEIADNHSDVAVLTASAINPRMIAPPLVAKLTTLTLRKIVGVIFDHGKAVGGKQGAMELCDCGGEARVKAAFAELQGLVEVSGHSAEPQALDKQFLIIGKAISPELAVKGMVGRPVIVEDSTGSRYFKRYRISDQVVILESLEIGGNFNPVVLAHAADGTPHVAAVWPVLGVLFERPK